MQIDVSQAICDYDNTPITDRGMLSYAVRFSSLVEFMKRESPALLEKWATADAADTDAHNPLTLRKQLMESLMLSSSSNQKPLSTEEKYRRGALGNRLYEASQLCELRDEDEIETLKEMVGETCGPLVVYRVFDMLESAKTPEK